MKTTSYQRECVKSGQLGNGVPTETGGEQGHVEVRHQFLGIRIEHAMPGSNVARQTHTDDLKDSLKDQKDKVRE